MWFLGPIIASVVGGIASVAAKVIYDKATAEPGRVKCPKCQQRECGSELGCCKTLICEECKKGMCARGKCEYCGSDIKWA